MKESFANLEHFCQSVGIEESDVVKVYMPNWWSEPDVNVVGYTDDKGTYCCELSPSVFVWVPEYDYDGYFFKRDLEVIK
jgi:hypothetical protein